MRPVPSIVTWWACIAGSPPWWPLFDRSTADEVAAGDEGVELVDGQGSGRLAEPAVGDEREPFRRDAGVEDRLDPGSDLAGRLDVAVLDVDHAGGDVPAGVGDLAKD